MSELELPRILNDVQIADFVTMCRDIGDMQPNPTFDTHIEARPKSIRTTDTDCCCCASFKSPKCPGKANCPHYLDNR